MTTTDKSLKDKAVKIKGKDYVQVKDRIKYLSDNYDGRYEMDSEYDYYPERKMWVVKATLTIWDENHNHARCYTGLAQEVESENYKEVNFSSALENCETSAWGRACAAFGLGIECSGGIASANEMQKAMNRQKTVEPTEPEKKGNPNGWFQKATTNKEFMEKCMDEDNYVRTIKGKYEVDDIVESQLREAYRNVMGKHEDKPDNLPFN